MNRMPSLKTPSTGGDRLLEDRRGVLGVGKPAGGTEARRSQACQAAGHRGTQGRDDVSSDLFRTLQKLLRRISCPQTGWLLQMVQPLEPTQSCHVFYRIRGSNRLLPRVCVSEYELCRLSLRCGFVALITRSFIR